MAYCTLQQLNDRFGPATIVALTDRADEPTGQVDLEVLNRAIDEADATIDGYLAARYALPLAAVPSLLTTLSMDITIWRLHLSEPSAKVKADYDAALRSLRGQIDTGGHCQNCNPDPRPGICRALVGAKGIPLCIQKLNLCAVITLRVTNPRRVHPHSVLDLLPLQRD